MRELYRRCRGNKEEACALYARAEQTGEVERKSNQRGISAKNYAGRLWHDGIRKGWLSE
jgi:hypothetical protein